MKRAALYRDKFLQEVFAIPWLALKRAGCYRDLRKLILKMALPDYFQWEIGVLRQEMTERWHMRPCCFPYINTVVDLCPEIPFGEQEGNEMRLMPFSLPRHKFQPLKREWLWVHLYATDL